MNALRRRTLANLMDQLTDLKIDIETEKDAEYEYYENMPESLQGGEKGEKAEQAASDLDEAIDSIDSAIASIERAIEK